MAPGNAQIQWRSPPAELQIASNEVHVWRCWLDLPPDTLQPLAASLSPDEQQRAERFRFDRDRNRFIAGRGWLRSLLARYLQVTPSSICFDYLPHGKPILASGGDLHFNLSHSHNLALCAIADQQPVGIDLEYLRPVAVADLAQRFFRPGEWATLATLDGIEQQRTFFRYWTCKEAYLKACGDGLGKLQTVEISLDGSARLAWLEDDRNDRWSLWELYPDQDCTAAIVVAGQNLTLCLWECSP